MQYLGFSSGALAKGDFRHALDLIAPYSLNALELSALREEELLVLRDAWAGLNLSSYQFLSFHAPSQLARMSEKDLVRELCWFAQNQIPIVVHPDIIITPSLWQQLDSYLLLENMDTRKSVGRTSEELSRLFEQLPNARLCLDLGHSKLVDPSMHETRMILQTHGHRLAEVHLSEVNGRCGHERLNELAIAKFQSLAPYLPPEIPVILESPVATPELISQELENARRALPELARR